MADLEDDFNVNDDPWQGLPDSPAAPTPATRPPLGLPPGSVRAIIAIAVALTLCGIAVLGRTPPDWLVSIGAALLGEYVGRRGSR